MKKSRHMGERDFFGSRRSVWICRGWRGSCVPLPIHQTFIKSEQWVYSILKNIYWKAHRRKSPTRWWKQYSASTPIVPQKEEESNRKKNHAASRFPLLKLVRMVRR